MVSETDRAYLAGLIDGEGSIGIDNHGGVRSPSVRVTLTNTDIDTLAELKALWGGCLASRRPRKFGWKPVADLIWAGKTSTEVLEAIYPYLRIKKAQCKIALQFNKTVNPNQTRGVDGNIQLQRKRLRGLILDLNKRGISQPILFQ